MTILLTAALATVSAAQDSAELPALSRAVVGGDHDYVIRRGDMLLSIGADFGVDARTIAEMNHIGLNSIIYPGQRLRIDNRHIVPLELHEGIVINVPQRMLFLFKDGRLIGHYPVAVGRPSWRTPCGRFSIKEKRKNPEWRVPASIQEEMRREGQIVRQRVPPGLDNPLGEYWLGLSINGYGIHGTNAPESIYTFGTHGCIRLHPDDAKQVFENVKVGDPGELIYQPYLLARLSNGRVFAEVDPDIYRKRGSAILTLRRIAVSNHIENLINWPLTAELARRAYGIARDVTAVEDPSGGGAR